MPRLVIAGLLALITLIGCNRSQPPQDLDETTRHTFSEQGFSISFPSHWGVLKNHEQTNDGSASTVVTAVSPDPRDSSASINVSFVQLPEEMTNKQLFDLNLPGMQQLPGFRESARGEAVVAGLPAQWITFTHDESGRRKEATLYSVVKDRKAFLLTLSTSESAPENVQRAFKDALRLMEIR